VPNIDLGIGIYRMTQLNTSKIGTELADNAIQFIPEAHCYLKINGKRIDLTTKKFEFQQIEKDIIQEKKLNLNKLRNLKLNIIKRL